MEEYLHATDVVFSGKPGHQEQVEKETEKYDLSYDSQELDGAVFFRPFFFQF